MAEAEAALAQDDVSDYFRAGEFDQEDIELMSSLPREEGWVSNHSHQYQGFWYTTKHMTGVLACQKRFQSQDDDIFVVTTPKAGTTWLKSILFALVNRVQHNPDPELKRHPLLTNNSHVLIQSLEIQHYVGNQDPDLTSMATPRLFSTHMPYVSIPESVKINSTCKLVYMCRDPKDTLISMWHHINKLRRDRGMIGSSLEEAFEIFCSGVCPFGPFWDHVLGYWNASLEMPQRVFFIKYEEMKQQPDLQLTRLADFLGCPFSPEEETQGMVQNITKLCSFEILSNLEVNKSGRLDAGYDNSDFFRRGEVKDWMNYLTPDMAKKIDRITENKWQGSGLHF